MVHGNQELASPGSRDANAVTVLTERMRLVMGMYEQMRQLLMDWNRAAEKVPDEVMIAVAHCYQDMCRDLAKRVEDLKRDAEGFPIDTEALIEARHHLKVVDAFSPEESVKAVAEIRAGRFITLEQMRHELRNSTR